MAQRREAAIVGIHEYPLRVVGPGTSALQIKAASAAKVQIGRAGRFIGQNAVQIHGGMGITEELRVGHYFKRLTMIDTQFGNVDYHMKRYAGLSE